jgi:acetolactate synthase-1/2/3 large subunit
MSKWVRECSSSADFSADATDAVAAAMAFPRGSATLVMPADISWKIVAGTQARPRPLPPQGVVPGETIEAVRQVLMTGEPTTFLIGGLALRERGLRAATAVAVATGSKLLAETFPARLERGGDVPPIGRLNYLGEMAIGELADVRHLVLVGTPAPASFFAYPDQVSELWSQTCQLHVLAGPEHDLVGALESLADAVSPTWASAPQRSLNGSGSEVSKSHPTGPLTAESMAVAVASVLPEGAVVVDESNTAGMFLFGATAGSPRHDLLTNCGGAIGLGLPVATGAAIGAPDRPVICLQADGSAMYTIQALWTQAREGLDVTTVILSNRSYAILNLELARVGAGAGGPRAESLLDLTGPELDFVSLARGMGVPGTRATTAEELVVQLQHALAEPGPHLIEAMLPEGLG